jgi:hypothetical protein
MLVPGQMPELLDVPDESLVVPVDPVVVPVEVVDVACVAVVPPVVEVPDDEVEMLVETDPLEDAEACVPEVKIGPVMPALVEAP